MKRSIRNTLSVFMLSAYTLTSTPAMSEEVYMIRGFLSLYSHGMTQMARKLKTEGVRAKVISNNNWSSTAADIVARAKEKKVSYPIVIVGFSQGAVAAVRLANTLGKEGVSTALLIGLDPGLGQPPALTRGAVKVVNYKTPSGKDFLKGRGFRGKIKTHDVSKYRTNHATISSNAKIQKMVITNIRKQVKK